jgi:N-acetylglucosaminylphosphatidylinositol deacetylase
MWTSTRSKGIAKPGSNILLIIAHPDDEAMFFSPLLIALKENLCKVSMLCLSTGGFDGLGSTRRVELMKSADCYGIDHKCVKIIDNDQLQDGKDSIWSPDIVRDVILECMSNTEFDAVSWLFYISLTAAEISCECKSHMIQ